MKLVPGSRKLGRGSNGGLAMSASAVFFLFMIVTGQGDSASLATLAEFKDQDSCSVAAKSVEAALKDATSVSHVFCVSSDDVTPLARAAHQ